MHSYLNDGIFLNLPRWQWEFSLSANDCLDSCVEKDSEAESDDTVSSFWDLLELLLYF